MSKKFIATENAPGPIGPYSQAIHAGEFIYIAGQGGLDPGTGKIVSGGVTAQAEQTMANLQAVLEAAGATFEDVIKTNIYLRYIKDFEAVNQVYSSYFGDQKPARSTIAAAALPAAALVEIEMIAYAPARAPEAAVEKAAKKKPKGTKKKGKKKKNKK